jgi:hypothetical protein
MRRAIGGTVPGRTGLASTGLALTAVAAALLLAWPAGPAMAAPASPRSATPSSARSAASERFYLISRNPSTRRAKLQATGALTADGYALAGDFASQHGVSRLVFPDGTLRLVTKEKQSSESVPNPTTCKFTEVFSGDYVIRSGAGSYQGASGSGRYVSRIFGQLKMASGGGCGTQLASFRQATRTAGSLHLPS